MNIVGEGLHKNIIDQINQRQKVHGSGYAGGISRTPEQIVYLNANSSWCKLMSSTNITDINVINNPTLKELKLTGNELAKKYVLFNGTSFYESGSTYSRSGITDQNSILGEGSKGNKSAYGIGGTDFGLNPMPGIQSISVTSENRGSLRMATVKMKAWNKAQFEIIDVLYLRLGYSVLLEWGNSMYFNDKGELQNLEFPNNTLDYVFLNGAYNSNEILRRIQELRLNTFGNYDAIFAKVKNFQWSFQKDGSYDITLNLISSGDIIESLKANAIIEDATKTSSIAKGDEGKVEPPENDNERIDFFAKKSSLGQFLYYLKYQLDENGEEKEKNRKIFSFSNASKEQIEEANKDISDSNNTKSIIKNPWVLATAAVLLTVATGGIGTVLVLGAAAAALNAGGAFDEQGLLPTSITPEIFKVYDENGKEIVGIVDAIQIPWDDKEGNNETYYVRLGTLLAYMQNYLMPRSTPSLNKTSLPLINIDYDQNTNIMYTHKWQVSVDPRICVVGREISILVGTFWETWEKASFSPDCSPFINDKFSKISENIEYGNIMNIYVNMVYILNKIDELKDDKGKISLFDLLKAICDGINEGLGGLNSLEPIIEEISNTIKIIDANPLPNRDKIITKINELYKTDISTELASFDLYGYTTDANGVGKSSFIRDFNFTTEITPEYATMITVGAAANGSVVGSNSTALSKLNIGLEDRYKKEITDAYISTKQKAANLGSQAATASRELSDLKERYENTIIEYFDFLEEMSDNVSKPTLNVEEVDTYKTTISNIVQMEEQTRHTEYMLNTLKSGKDPNSPTDQNTMSSGTGFIPFNLSLTMDGLSGPKIYNKFTVDTRYLPSNYPDSVEFLIKGITHEIGQDNKWITKLESLAISKGTFKESTQNDTQSTQNDTQNDTQNVENEPESPYIDPNLKKNENVSKDCGTPIINNIPSDPSNLSNAKYKDALNKALQNTFKNGDGESGMCALYTNSVATSFINILKNKAPGPQFTRGIGNAKTDSVRSYLTKIGYNVNKLGENISKAEIQKLLNNRTYNIGDILIYWAKDGDPEAGCTKYGHIEIYSGKVWNPYTYKKSQTNYVSSVPDNYTTNPFVYSNNQKYPQNCWVVFLCKTPII